MKEALVEDAELPPIGKARIVRPGDDVTVIVYSAMVRDALMAAESLARDGISVEVIDLRTLVPLDMQTIATSVSKTHRVMIAHEAVRNGGVGAEIAARIGTELFDELDDAGITCRLRFRADSVCAGARAALLPGTGDIVCAVRGLLGLAPARE